MLDVNLNYYKTFFVCAHCRTLTEAAQQLYTSQPAVTRAIQQLEEQLRCPLFVRSHSGLSLTTEGELLLGVLSDVFERIESVENRIRTVREGGVRVGVNNLASEWIARRISETMEERSPNISVMTVSLDIRDFENALLSRQIDLALNMNFYTPEQRKSSLRQYVYTSSRIAHRTFGPFEDSFLVGPLYSELAGRKASIDKLAALPCIMPLTQSPSSRYYLSMLRGGAMQERDFPVNGPEHRISLARWNHGLTAFPACFVRQMLENQELFRLESDAEMCFSSVTVARDTSAAQSMPSLEFEKLLLELVSGAGKRRHI